LRVSQQQDFKKAITKKLEKNIVENVFEQKSKAVSFLGFFIAFLRVSQQGISTTPFQKLGKQSMSIKRKTNTKKESSGGGEGEAFLKKTKAVSSGGY
jgi:hypothetical protein